MKANSDRDLPAGAEDDIIDLTGYDRAPWLTASTGASVVEVGNRRRWKRASPTITSPKGTKHAYRTGRDFTACGLPLADLHEWEEHPFGDGLLNRCPICLARTRAALPHEPGIERIPTR